MIIYMRACVCVFSMDRYLFDFIHFIHLLMNLQVPSNKHMGTYIA